MPGRDRRTFVSLAELFPQSDPDQCRVCQEDVRPPKQKYCSDYCRQIAKNVQKLFSWNFIRDLVAERDGECVKCGSTDDYQVDHIIPVSKGGHPFDPENMQRLCDPCHTEKGVSETDYRDDGDGGVLLFPGNSAAQLTFEEFEANAGDVVDTDDSVSE